MKIIVLEITSRDIFLIFLFIRYDTAIIKQSSSYFFGKKFLISLLLQALNEVSQNNFFLVFLYIRSSKVNSILIISGFSYCSISSILIGSFSSSSFSSKLLLLLYLIKILAAGRPVAKILMEYIRHCVFWLHYYRIRQFM